MSSVDLNHAKIVDRTRKAATVTDVSNLYKVAMRPHQNAVSVVSFCGCARLADVPLLLFVLTLSYSSQGLSGKLRASKPPIAAEKEKNKALAEKQRGKKKKKSDRNVRKENERRELEKLRRRQADEGLP